MRRRTALLIVFVLTWLLAGGGPWPALAQESGDAPSYTFGGEITFRLSLPEEPEIAAVEVFIQEEESRQPIVGTARLEGNQAIYTLDLADQPLRAFSTVQYWYRLTPVDGEAYTTAPENFVYEDNRFEWQTLESEPFRVHWYEGDAAMGQMVLNAAQEGLDRANTLLKGLAFPEPIRIYIYASGQELQSALRLGGLSWVAGHADPELNLMMVSLPPGPDQRLEIERQVPHELMHILMYQAIGEGYENLPTWFKEGVASANELRPNPDYYVILRSATEKGALIPLISLCERFPQDANVYLAYAEADSFVRDYLKPRFGAQGLGALMAAYGQGAGCEYGAQAALGRPLSELEKEWRREVLGEEVFLKVMEALLPWLALLAATLAVPLILTVHNLKSSKTIYEKVSRQER